MRIADILKIALRNVLRHKRRTLLSMASVAFGVIAIVLSGGFIEDTIVETGESMIRSYSGHVQVAKRDYWKFGTRNPEAYLIEDPERLRNELLSVSDVSRVLLRVGFTGLLGNGKTDWPIVGEGVEPEGEAHLGTYVTMSSGRHLRKDDKFGMVIGKGVADTLHVGIGDTVTLMASAAGGAANVLEFEILGIMQTFSKDHDARVVRISLDDARLLMGSSGIHTAVVLLDHTKHTDNAAGIITRDIAKAGFEVKTWVELNDFYVQTVDLYNQQFGFLTIVIVIMLLLSVSNAINVGIFERTSEFGTLMAMGNGRGLIGRLITIECLFLGIAGSAVGVALGALLASAISSVGIPMPPPPNADLGYVSKVLIVPSVLVIAFMAGVLSTALASILPSRVIRRMEICHALRTGI